MRNDRVDGEFYRDKVNSVFIEDRCFVWPPDCGLRVTSFPPAGILVLTHIPVNTGSSADAKDIVDTSLYDGIVWNALPALVGYFLLGEIGRVIVISPDEYNPVVRFSKPKPQSPAIIRRESFKPYWTHNL